MIFLLIPKQTKQPARLWIRNQVNFLIRMQSTGNSQPKLTLKLLWLVTLLSVIHHVDHILRVDHSGWPFVARISPFTYSLLAYPILMSVLVAGTGSWYRVAGLLVLFLFATLAHIFFEPLRDKYHTWTYGSNLAGHVGEPNLLGIHSNVLGITSVSIAVLLSVLLLMALLSAIGDARKSAR